MPASACLKKPMICSSVNLLFFMSVILHGDGLHKLYVGTASGGQVISITRPFTLLIVLPALFISLFNAFLIEYQIYQRYDFFHQAPISKFWNWLTWFFLSVFAVPGVDLGKEIRPLLFGTGTFISFIALLIEIIQKAVALAGFFLIGLALRNLFKLK
jgi:hypothetical protein